MDKIAALENNTEVRVKYDGENECDAFIVGIASNVEYPVIGRQYIFRKSDDKEFSKDYPYSNFVALETWIIEIY